MTKISAFTTVTNPERRQDRWIESINSVLPWADEVVIIHGIDDDRYEMEKIFKGNKFKYYFLEWPYEWNWLELPKHMQKGLDLCTGDWAVRFDIDYIFEEEAVKTLPRELELYSDCRVVTLQKMSVLTTKKVYQKGPTRLCFNKRFKDTGIGEAINERTDLCMPIVIEGINEKGINYGKAVEGNQIGRGHVKFYNFDYTFKTKDFTKREFARFSRAYKRYFGTTSWGNTEEESFEVFIRMMKGRLDNKNLHKYDMKPEDYPKWIQDEVKSIKPTQLGFDLWGYV